MKEGFGPLRIARLCAFLKAFNERLHIVTCKMYITISSSSPRRLGKLGKEIHPLIPILPADSRSLLTLFKSRYGTCVPDERVSRDSTRGRQILLSITEAL